MPAKIVDLLCMGYYKTNNHDFQVKDVSVGRIYLCRLVPVLLVTASIEIQVKQRNNVYVKRYFDILFALPFWVKEYQAQAMLDFIGVTINSL